MFELAREAVIDVDKREGEREREREREREKGEKESLYIKISNDSQLANCPVCDLFECFMVRYRRGNKKSSLSRHSKICSRVTFFVISCSEAIF